MAVWVFVAMQAFPVVGERLLFLAVGRLLIAVASPDAE